MGSPRVSPRTMEHETAVENRQLLAVAHDLLVQVSSSLPRIEDLPEQMEEDLHNALMVLMNVEAFMRSRSRELRPETKR